VGRAGVSDRGQSPEKFCWLYVQIYVKNFLVYNHV